jgi:hypothetical protein
LVLRHARAQRPPRVPVHGGGSAVARRPLHTLSRIFVFGSLLRDFFYQSGTVRIACSRSIASVGCLPF